MDNSVKVFDKVLADALAIKEQGNFLPDCSTKDGYEASKRFVLDVTTKARSALSAAHKDAKAYWLEGGRNVDAKKKELEQMLLEIEAPHKEAYKAVDDEKKRIKEAKEAALQNGIDFLNGLVNSALGASSDQISELLDDCSCFDIDPELYEKSTDFIADLQQKTIDKLTDALTSKLSEEEMARKYAEMEAKQAAMDAKIAEQERLEREAIQREQMRVEAEQAAAAQIEQAKRDAANAEARRIEQEEAAKVAAENARIEAERQAKIQAEMAVKAEAARLKAIQEAEKAEAERREADKKHRSSINNQALDCLVAGGMDKEQAKLAVKLIASRNVAHIQINY